MPTKHGYGYQNIWYKLKRRDAKIIRLNKKIENLLTYIRKRTGLLNYRRHKYRELRGEFSQYKKENGPALKFFKAPLDKRRFNLLNYMVRFNKTINKFSEETNTHEILILSYLANTESSGYTQMQKYLEVSRSYLNRYISNLIEKGFVNQGKVRVAYYVYITQAGRDYLNNFQTYMTKQRILGI